MDYHATMRRNPLRTQILLRAALPWLKKWILLQAACIAVFAVCGEYERAGTISFIYIANALLFLFLVPAGIAFATGNRVPLFPILRRRLSLTPQFIAGTHRREKSKAVLTVFSRSAFRLLAIGALTLTPILFALLLFHFHRWTVSVPFGQSLAEKHHSNFANGFLLVYLIVSAAVSEEIIFRHYLLNRILATAAGKRRSRFRVFVASCLAITISSFVFMLGHASMVSPEWMKYAQTFVLGACLGCVQLFAGTEACIFGHLLFNATMAIAAQWLAS